MVTQDIPGDRMRRTLFAVGLPMVISILNLIVTPVILQTAFTARSSARTVDYLDAWRFLRTYAAWHRTRTRKTF